MRWGSHFAAFATAALALGSLEAAAQSALKCPAPGTVVEYSDGSQTTWRGPAANGCLFQRRNTSGQTQDWVFYAPAALAPERISAAWAQQLKPWELWPLTVGKTLRGRYEGEGNAPGYQSRWDMRWTIERTERLTTRAGTFDTVIVLWQSDQLPPSNWKSTLRQWYSPDPGVVVKWDYSDNQMRNESKSAGEAVAIRR